MNVDATRSEVPPRPAGILSKSPAGEAATLVADGPGEKDVGSRRFGRVVSAIDHSPVRGAVIAVPAALAVRSDHHEVTHSLEDFSEVARTDVDGRFELATATVGRILVVTATGLGTVLIDRAWLAESKDSALEIPLAPSAKLIGKVLDRVGVPKQDCEVRLQANAYDAVQPSGQDVDHILMMTVGARRKTDDQGEATFDALPAGVPFDLEIWAGDMRLVRDPGRTVLEVGKTTSKEWRLGSGCIVRGRVIDQFEHPVRGEKLWLSQSGLMLRKSARRAIFYSGDEDKIAKSAVTDESGSFAIDDVSPGTWWLGVAASYRNSRFKSGEDAEVAPVAEALELAGDRSFVDVLLRVHRGLFIRGKMLDPDGKPSAGHVSAYARVAGLVGFMDGDCDQASGEFEIGPLEPGEYELEGSAWNFPRNDVTCAPCLPVLVAAGRDDVVLQLRRGGTIRPKAVRKDTGSEVPAGFCLVSATEPGTLWGCGEYSANTVSDFAGLAPDTYDLAALTPDGCAGRVRGIVVGAGAVVEDVRVPVEPGGRVSCRYVGTKSEYGNVELWVDSTYYGGDGIHRGTTRTLVAPHGRVTVRWQAESERFDEVVELAVGETRELTWPQPSSSGTSSR